MNDDRHDPVVAEGAAYLGCPGSPERSSGRLGVSLEARLRPCRRGSPGLGVRVTDVCLGGLSLEFTAAPPEPGQVLVELCLPGLAECQVLPGRLSWLQRDGDSWRAGVELAEDTAWAWFAALKGMVRALANAPH